MPEFYLYEDGGVKDNERIDGTISFGMVGAMTFEEFVLDSWHEELGVSQTDWYNATIADLHAGQRNAEYPVMFRNSYRLQNNLMQWYAYEITIAPGQRIVNTVTAPLYPTIDAKYEPTVYEYTYLLSPAKTWKSFGTLDIVINTPNYVIESSLEGFEKTDNGYKLTLDGLPDCELTFQISASENPEAPKSNPLSGFFYFLILIFSYIGYLFESLLDAIIGLFIF